MVGLSVDGLTSRAVFSTMKFQPAIPTRGSKVPAGPESLHEVKYDGMAKTCGGLPLSMRKASLARLLRGRPDGIFVGDV
jgi:hypothetical protein